MRNFLSFHSCIEMDLLQQYTKPHPYIYLRVEKLPNLRFVCLHSCLHQLIYADDQNKLLKIIVCIQYVSLYHPFNFTREPEPNPSFSSDKQKGQDKNQKVCDLRRVGHYVFTLGVLYCLQNSKSPKTSVLHVLLPAVWNGTTFEFVVGCSTFVMSECVWWQVL